jgi:hypothetical protein
MLQSIEMKSLGKSPDQQQEPFSLHSTLDQYEVEEINAKQFVNLVGQTRRKARSTHPSAAQSG